MKAIAVILGILSGSMFWIGLVWIGRKIAVHRDALFEWIRRKDKLSADAQAALSGTTYDSSISDFKRVRLSLNFVWWAVLYLMVVAVFVQLALEMVAQ